MKKIFLIFFLLSVYCFSLLMAQLPVQKAVAIRLQQNKKLCFEKTDSFQLILNTYAELATQEWKILPSDEPDFYYMQSAGEYHLILDSDTTQIVNSCHLTVAPPEGDDYKFSFKLLSPNQWCIAPKSNPDLCLQTYKGGNMVYALPQQEFGTSAFLIDTIPPRRPKPALTSFSALACDAGLLMDGKPQPVYGADATFFQAGMYPAQYIVRVYLSPDRKNRIDVIVFDDVKLLRRDKTYSVRANGPKAQPVVTLVKNDKTQLKLDEAVCKIMNINWTNNTIEFRLEGAKSISTNNQNQLPQYDFIYKGLIRLQ